eukprot:COSAG05_NODE_999_length_6247_cov_26.499024_2_plen_46_part_00
MICGTDMLGNALSCKGMDACDKKFKDRHDKNVHNYGAHGEHQHRN